jgi:hypothetical protein
MNISTQVLACQRMVPRSSFLSLCQLHRHPVAVPLPLPTPLVAPPLAPLVVPVIPPRAIPLPLAPLPAVEADAPRLGCGGRVFNERCVRREESGVNIGWCGLRGYVAIRVVLRVRRGEVFGASKGLWCRCLRAGVSVRPYEIARKKCIPLGSPHRKRSCLSRTGSLRSTR